MAELADAPDLGSGVYDVQVQVLLSAGKVWRPLRIRVSNGRREFSLIARKLSFFRFDINVDINGE